MSDIISRNDTIEIIKAMQDVCRSESDKILLSKVWSQIKDMPSARPTGHWINHITEWECSNCSYTVQGWQNTSYCPNCGARME